MRNALCRIGCAVAVSIAVCGSAAADGPKWLPSIDFEAKPGTKRNIGEADIFAPLAQSSTTMLFANARFRLDDYENREGNFGLGVRHMLSSGWNIGAYGYFDRRRTSYDNYFNQATLGVEALGRDFDARFNAYLPVGERVKDAGSSPEASFASLVGTSVQVTTLGATLRQERAMRGFDGEVGMRIPIWEPEAKQALRLYVGGYHFSDDLVKTITGPRARLELALYELPALWRGARLTLGAEFQHDDVRGSQGFGMVRLSVPLGVPRGETKLTAQERRMVERIVRDVDVVTQSYSSQAPTTVETATQLASGKQFSVINSASTSGNNLNTAVNAAGNNSTVILNGTFQVSGGNGVSLAFGQSLMGGAISVRSASGRIATLYSPASIVGTNVNLATVQVNAGGTLSGLTIAGNYSGGLGGRAVIVADGSANVTIANNTLVATHSGGNNVIALGIGSNTSSTVTGNTLTATASGASNTIALAINNANTVVTVAGNSMSASGGVINTMVVQGAGTTVNAGSTGNVRGSGVCTGTPASGSIAFTNGTTCP
ncbi:MAG: inverse autotransporter beta domain-containing protein [Pseudomonadota bacterium]